LAEQSSKHWWWKSLASLSVTGFDRDSGDSSGYALRLIHSKSSGKGEVSMIGMPVKLLEPRAAGMSVAELSLLSLQRDSL
jgi:hypothetical protein